MKTGMVSFRYNNFSQFQFGKHSRKDILVNFEANEFFFLYLRIKFFHMKVCFENFYFYFSGHQIDF